MVTLSAFLRVTPSTDAQTHVICVPKLLCPHFAAKSACSEAVGRLVGTRIALQVSQMHCGRIRMLTA